jgi:hypothetical protein
MSYNEKTQKEVTMTMPSSRIATLEAQAQKIRAKLNEAKARERAVLSREARKLDTRRKIVLGGLVLSLVRSGVLEAALLDEWIAQGNLPERDRDLLAQPW